MRLFVLAALVIAFPIVGMASGHYLPDKAGLFMSISVALSTFAASAWFRTRKATRK